MSLAILLPLVAGILGAIISYFGTVKKLSGTIQTSTAEDLWSESRQIRKDLMDRIDSMQSRIDELLFENQLLRREVEGLRMDLLKMRLKYEEPA